MTINEFKAWLDGYTENLKGTPTKAQWLRIKEKLEDVYECPPHFNPFWYPVTPISPTPWRWYNEPCIVPYETTDGTGTIDIRWHGSTSPQIGDCTYQTFLNS